MVFITYKSTHTHSHTHSLSLSLSLPPSPSPLTPPQYVLEIKSQILFLKFTLQLRWGQQLPSFISLLRLFSLRLYPSLHHFIVSSITVSLLGNTAGMAGTFLWLESKPTLLGPDCLLTPN